MRRFILLVILFTTGCAVWIQAGGPYTSKSLNFSAELPQGWMRLNTTKHLLVTRDGVLLQNVIIERIAIDEEFEHTKRKLSKEMLPQETAEVIIDNISSNQSVLNFEVLENSPAEISGFPGFRLVFMYKNEDGLRSKSIFYGFMKGEWFYSISYNSALRHYFEKDLETFEKVLNSFKLIDSA